MKIRITVLSIVTFLFSTNAMRADWQYTKWGMSPEEVQSATGVDPVENEEDANGGPSYTPFYVGYNGAGIPFLAYFVFSRASNGLIIVRLKASPNTDCASLSGKLKEIYGTPSSSVEVSNTYYRRWRDVKNKNSITYWENKGRCTIDYSSLDEPGAAGGL